MITSIGAHLNNPLFKFFISGGVAIGSGQIIKTAPTEITQICSTTTHKLASQHITENAQVGTTYILVLTDDGKRVTCTNGAAITVTVPPNSSVAFPIGTMIVIEQWGAGLVSIAEGAGVTINSFGSALDFTGQYAVAVLTKDATDIWILSGQIE